MVVQSLAGVRDWPAECAANDEWDDLTRQGQARPKSGDQELHQVGVV